MIYIIINIVLNYHSYYMYFLIIVKIYIQKATL